MATLKIGHACGRERTRLPENMNIYADWFQALERKKYRGQCSNHIFHSQLRYCVELYDPGSWSVDMTHVRLDHHFVNTNTENRYFHLFTNG